MLNHKNLLWEVQICKQKCHKQQSIYDEIMNSDLSALNPMGDACGKLVKGEYMKKVYIYIYI